MDGKQTIWIVGGEGLSLLLILCFYVFHFFLSTSSFWNSLYVIILSARELLQLFYTKHPPYNDFPSARRSTICAIFLFLASGPLAVSILWRIGYLLVRFNPSNVATATPPFAFIASSRSAGTTISFGPEYARSQRPSAFAASICASPAGRRGHGVRARKVLTLSTFLLDHILAPRRGVKRCAKCVEGSSPSPGQPFRWPSIQPKKSEASTAWS